MPSPRAYQSLVELGVLNTSSEKAIQSTYQKFMDAMKDWEHIDLNEICRLKGVTFSVFANQHLDSLKKSGIIKDIARTLGSGVKSFYVIYRGKKPDLYKAVGLKDLE